MRIREIINQSIETKRRVLSDEKLLTAVRRAADLCVESFRKGNKVLFCGNGGSAADAQHLAAEFSGRFYYDRPPLPSEALHVNTSYLTAVANDYSYDDVYARIVMGSGRNGDILIGLSTSGNSENVIRAFLAARGIGMTTIALTGMSGGKLKEVSDILLNIPSIDTPRIQESHIMIGHIICELVESEMFPQKKDSL